MCEWSVYTLALTPAYGWTHMRLARGWRAAGVGAAADERLKSDEAVAAAEVREARPACVRMCGMWRGAGGGAGNALRAGPGKRISQGGFGGKTFIRSQK